MPGDEEVSQRRAPTLASAAIDIGRPKEKMALVRAQVILQGKSHSLREVARVIAVRRVTERAMAPPTSA